MNEVVLITGASSGMGQATAERLNKHGYKVYAAARRTDRMADMQAQGIQTRYVDLTKDESMVKLVEDVIAKEGHIDVLINNAGYGSFGAVEDVPLADAKRQFEVNLFGMGRMTQLVLPYMRAQHSGKIVNVSSMGGKINEPLGSWYHSAKFAVEGLSDSMRLELKPFGIDVIIIEPGLIQTEWEGISAKSLLKTSGDTAYSKMAHQMANILDGGAPASKPEVIAKLTERAIEAKHPKTRYAGGMGAKPLIFLKWALPDKAFDALWMGVLKLQGNSNQDIAEKKAQKEI